MDGLLDRTGDNFRGRFQVRDPQPFLELLQETDEAFVEAVIEFFICCRAT